MNSQIKNIIHRLLAWIFLLSAIAMLINFEFYIWLLVRLEYKLASTNLNNSSNIYKNCWINMAVFPECSSKDNIQMPAMLQEQFILLMKE